MFYEYAQKHQRALIKEMKSLSKELQKYPDGELICYNNGKYSKWFIEKNGMKTYLPKAGNRFLAQTFARKKLLTTRLSDLSNEEKALSRYLQKHASYSPQLPQITKEGSPYLPLLPEEEIRPISWAMTDYPRNPYRPEELIHKTPYGFKTRSKSEAMIVGALTRHGISFRYECEVIINGRIYYPDFIIRHPVTGELYYWEHLGIMDDMSYLHHNLNKISDYAGEGIFAGEQLILTFETKRAPLTEEMIELIIKYYFE